MTAFDRDRSDAVIAAAVERSKADVAELASVTKRWSWLDDLDDVYSEPVSWSWDDGDLRLRVVDDGGVEWTAPQVDLSPGDVAFVTWNPPTLVVERAAPGRRVWWAPWRRRKVIDRYPLRAEEGA